MIAAFAFTLSALVSFAPPLSPEEDRVEFAKLQGTWQITRVEEGGKVWPKEKLEKAQLIVTRSRFRIEDGKSSLEGSITLETGKKPKTVDALVEFSGGPAAPALGIYKLDGDSLEVCFIRGKNRPEEFQTGPELPTMLFLAKRKAEPKAPH